MTKTGLVLEGGAMRGLFTSGILDVFMENGIEVDRAVGVSAGAVFGCNYKSKQIGRGIRYNLNYSKDWHYKGIRSLLLTGDAFGADFCYHKLPNELDIFDTDRFMKDPMELYCVATDVITGKAVYHKLTNGGYEDLEWVRASASMPLASKVVNIGGQKLLDGGLSDSIPLRFMEDSGFKRNIVILTQPEGYVKKQYKAIRLIKAYLHGYPELVKKIEERHNMYNDQTAYVKRAEEEGRILVIRPPEPLNISAFEKDGKELQRVYDLGVKRGKEKLQAVRSYIKGE